MTDAVAGLMPDYRSANPYQSMLYERLVESGVRLVRVDPAGDLDPRQGGAGPALLHVGWTAPVLQASPGPFSAAERLDLFLAGIARARAAGVRLVWTVHNVLPHDARFRTLEIELARTLAAEADLVHVLHGATPGLVAPWYDLPSDRVVVIPHSSYVGRVPDTVGRAGARRSLGLAGDARVLVAFGGVRPYKRIGPLLDAVEQLHRKDDRVRLLVAGRLSDLDGSEALRRRLESVPWVVASLAHVPDDEVQTWLRAADAGVVPQESVLNSGAYHLFLSFGLPVVAPRAGVPALEADPAYAALFDPDRPESLPEALQEGLRLADAGAGAAARAAAEASPPGAMAAAFADALAARFPEWGLLGNPGAPDRVAEMGPVRPRIVP